MKTEKKLQNKYVGNTELNRTQIHLDGKVYEIELEFVDAVYLHLLGDCFGDGVQDIQEFTWKEMRQWTEDDDLFRDMVSDFVPEGIYIPKNELSHILSERQWEYHYLAENGYEYEQIAEILGVSQSRVRNLRSEISQKQREFLAEKRQWDSLRKMEKMENEKKAKFSGMKRNCNNKLPHTPLPTKDEEGQFIYLRDVATRISWASIPQKIQEVIQTIYMKQNPTSCPNGDLMIEYDDNIAVSQLHRGHIVEVGDDLDNVLVITDFFLHKKDR